MRQLLLSLRPGLLQKCALLHVNSMVNLRFTLHQCIGFLDCTKIKVCSSSGHSSLEGSLCAEQQRFFCVIYMAITTSDSHVYALHGLIEERGNDLKFLRHNWRENVLQLAPTMKGEKLRVYVDAAFVLMPNVIVPFIASAANALKMNLNMIMSVVRVDFDRNYKDLKQKYSKNDFRRLQTLYNAPVTSRYETSALFLNMASCLYQGG